MTRRAISTMAACAALMAIGVEAAAADAVNVGVARCEADVRWQLSGDAFGGIFADMSYDTGTATGTGCKHLSAVIEDDGDPSIAQRDFGQADSVRFALFGVWGTGDFLFAGTATRTDQAASGPLTIVNGLLNATIVRTPPHGSPAVTEHRGIGTCGTRCFVTRSVWVAAG